MRLGFDRAMKPKARTAEEVLRELQKDPAWVAARRADEQKRKQWAVEFRRLERPILEDLRAVGVVVTTIGNAKEWERYVPLQPEVVEVLVRWLDRAHWKLKESLIRSLATAEKPFDGRPLVEVFEQILTEDLDELDFEEARAKADWGWVIGYTIAETRPHGITDWVIRTVQNPNLNKSREGLLLAVARMAPAEIARRILVPLFEEFPPHVAASLAECGGEAELAFLQAKEYEFKGPTRTEIRKAIKRIATRVRKTQ
jgi:hypothetical protein